MLKAVQQKVESLCIAVCAYCRLGAFAADQACLKNTSDPTLSNYPTSTTVASVARLGWKDLSEWQKSSVQKLAGLFQYRLAQEDTVVRYDIYISLYKHHIISFYTTLRDNEWMALWRQQQVAMLQHVCLTLPSPRPRENPPKPLAQTHEVTTMEKVGHPLDYQHQGWAIGQKPLYQKSPPNMRWCTTQNNYIVIIGSIWVGVPKGTHPNSWKLRTKIPNAGLSQKQFMLMNCFLQKLSAISVLAIIECLQLFAFEGDVPKFGTLYIASWPMVLPGKGLNLSALRRVRALWKEVDGSVFYKAMELVTTGPFRKLRMFSSNIPQLVGGFNNFFSRQFVMIWNSTNQTRSDIKRPSKRWSFVDVHPRSFSLWLCPSYGVRQKLNGTRRRELCAPLPHLQEKFMPRES